tara:strand:+ start:831 stop:1418 length:588 start_codon:yes stop_codon:yes gene_type:complete
MMASIKKSVQKGLRFRGLILIALVCICAYALYYQPKKVSSSGIAQKRPKVIFEEVTVTQFDGEHILWEMDAQSAQLDEQGQDIYLDAAKGTFVLSGDQVLNLQADKGRFVLDGSRMHLTGAHVHFNMDQVPLTVLMDQLDWHPVLRRLVGKGQVQVLSPLASVFGNRFLADLRTHQLKVYEQASATIKGPWPTKN